jgi:hypothetical protein
MAKNFEIKLKFTTGGTAQKLISKLTALADAQNRLTKSQKKFNTDVAKTQKHIQILTHREQKHIVSMQKQRKQMSILNNRIKQQNTRLKELQGKLKVATIAQNRMRISTAGLQRRLGAIRNKILLFTFAFGGAIAAIKGFVDTSAQFEAVKTRLNAMFGSVEKGTRAFETFNKIAATTPFTLTDVVEAGAALKAFGTNAEEMIKPTSDLAAFMGVTATEAAQALGRAFAGGAGAADILRERGILQLVRDFKGIEDLSKLTLPQFRKALTDTLLDPASGIAGATDALSKTMTGMMSNLSDSFIRMSAALGDIFNFRGQIKRVTSVFSSFANFLSEVNKTNIDKLKEVNKALGIEVKDDTLEKSAAALELRMQILKEGLDPTRTSSQASEELTQALLEEKEAREFLLSFGEKELQKEGVTKGLARTRVERAEKRRKALQEEVGIFKELADTQSQLTISTLNLDTANRDLTNSFADGVKLLDDIDTKFQAFTDIPELPIRMPEGKGLESMVQVFADNLAEEIDKIESEELDRALQSLLEFEQLEKGFIDSFASSFDKILSMQKENLDQRINNEIKALKKTDKFRNASMEQRQTMEDDIRSKFADEQKRLFRMQQLSQIAQVTMETAKNISALMTSALGASILDPTAPLRAKKISIAMAAISAAQIATIAGQQAPAFARGGSFTTEGEQFIKVGDNAGGRERVDITPLSSPDFGDAGEGSSINVNIMGNVIGTQEFVRDNLLPEIENTIKRNLA